VSESRPDFVPLPVVLTGDWVRLEPLKREHTAGLFAAGQDDEIWRYLPVPRQSAPTQTEHWIAEALAAVQQGLEIPFTIFNLESGRIVGSTRYTDIQPSHRGLEIGWTWLSPTAQRTGINSECKLLLLTHAFEVLGAERVCLKTDLRNTRSQAAIERIGAKREGVLRRHRLCWDGHWRDTVYFSMIRDEWPAVREALRTRIRR
jgi:RimJ/RimL family protein N-acetyltransferase